MSRRRGTTAPPGSAPQAGRRGARPRLWLRLYVAGPGRNSVAAQRNLRKLCGAWPPGAVQVEIVDVFRHPKRALEDGVRVTPTLVRLAPRPKRTIIGDLSDLGAVRAALGAARGPGRPPAGGGR